VSGEVAGVSVPDEVPVIVLMTLLSVLVTASVTVWMMEGLAGVDEDVSSVVVVATCTDVVASSVDVAVVVEVSSVEVDVVPVMVLIAFDTTSLMVSMRLADVVAVVLAVLWKLLMLHLS